MMSAMCVIYMMYLFFIRTMHAKMKIFDVMHLYLFLCDISCHMHHDFTLSHTLAPHGCNDLRGGLLCVLVCAN